MTARQFHNFLLVVAIASTLAVIGPALGEDPHEGPAEAAEAVQLQRAQDAHARMTAACQKRYGPTAQFVWPSGGQPACVVSQRLHALGTGGAL
jgi:hypothetical protein